MPIAVGLSLGIPWIVGGGAYVVSIAVTPANPTIVVGDTLAMTATATYSDGSTANVTALATWTSGTPAVATVSPVGVVTAVSVGSSLITATFEGVSGSTTATVVAAELWQQNWSVLSLGGASTPAGWTFSRASASPIATAQTGTNTVVTTAIANNQMRGGKREDADPTALVFEQSSSNEILSSRNPSATTWFPLGGTVETRPFGVGPDGDATTPMRTVGTGYGRYWTFAVSTGVTRMLSQWARSGTGIAAAARRQFGFASQDYTASVGWTRVSNVYTSTGVVHYLTPVNSLGSGQDVVHDLHQAEPGRLLTEAIVTGAVSVETRAPERLTRTTETRDGGRISLESVFQSKGALSDYPADMALWWIDANNYCIIKAGTGAVEMAVLGVVYTTPVAVSIAAFDVVSIYTAAGGGIACVAAYRIGAGAKITLSTGSPPSLGNIPSGTPDIACAGLANQLTAWHRTTTAYRSGKGPAWL